jgi:cytoskeletal protein CcmA (bactofilin family)
MVKGDVAAAGFTRVDGGLKGALTVAGRVVIGERGRLKSNITGTLIKIGGVVTGNVFASEGLVVLSTGLVIGDCITRRIEACDGCIIHGRIIVCPDEETFNAHVSEAKDAALIRGDKNG